MVKRFRGYIKPSFVGKARAEYPNKLRGLGHMNGGSMRRQAVKGISRAAQNFEVCSRLRGKF